MYAGTLGLVDPSTVLMPGGGLPAIFETETSLPYGGTASTPVAVSPTQLPPIGSTTPYTPFTPQLPTGGGTIFGPGIGPTTFPTILPPAPYVPPSTPTVLPKPPSSDNPATTPALPVPVTPDHPSAVIIGSSAPSPADAIPAIGTVGLVLGGLALLLLIGRSRRRR